MKTAIIRSSWLSGYGFRLDCMPYVSGALEAKILLERLPLRKDLVSDLVKKPGGGIYFAGREGVRWVESPEFGIPFLRGKDIQLADLSESPLISKRQVEENPTFLIHKGMTLITRSGTIGKTAYVRADMDGMATSDPLRIVPDPQKIPPGYLYAYISSEFGVPLLASGAYGAIIQHLEPSDIASIPVPRLGDALEHEIHELVEQAAELRTKASKHFQDVLAEFESHAGLPLTRQLKNQQFPLCSTAFSSKLNGRLDVNFHSPRHHSVIAPYIEKAVAAITVGELAESVVEPTRFKRIEHDNPECNAPLFGTGDIGNIDPEPISWITAFRGYESYAAGSLSVLIPRSGQLNGIIGTATLPIGGVRTGVVSEHAIRIFCRSEADAGYLFLALRSYTGYLQLKARAFGGSIPTLDVANVSAVLIPELSPKQRERFGTSAFEVATLRTKAIELENRARKKLVAAVQHAAKE